MRNRQQNRYQMRNLPPNSSSQEENKEEEENKGEHTQDQDKIDDTKAVSLETYVDKVLVPKYGKCTAGTYESKYVKKDGEKKIVQPERLEKQKGGYSHPN